MTKYNCKAEDFVLAWVGCHASKQGVEAVAFRLGMTLKDVRAFAGTLRSIGVKLPKMNRGRKPGDYSEMVDDLNSLIPSASDSTVALEPAE